MEIETARDATVHISDWENQTRRPPHAGEGVEQQELSLIAARKANGVATAEENLAFSYKIEHTLTIHPSNGTPRYLLKRAGPH